jgi:hypothetical protein
MGSSKTLKQTVKRAQKEIKKLLAEVQASKPDTSKLETGLKEVQGNLRVLDIHLHKRDDE